jgi:recombination protein RecA
MTTETATTTDKMTALREVVNKINKRFGANTLVFVGRDAEKMKVDVIPTQSLLLNVALGIGGVPKGRIIEVYGPEHTGKSSICYGILTECQKQGGIAALVDAENAFDPEFAKFLGLDLDNLLYCQPNSGEEAIDITEALIRSGNVDAIVVDSVAALVPETEVENDMSSNQMGLQGRLMSKTMRKLVGITRSHNVCLIFINQIREKIGVFYGNPEVTTGGRALKFFASVRIEMRRSEDFKEGTNVVGHKLKCKVIKNRLSVPYKICEIPIYYGKGIDRIDEMIQVGQVVGVIKRAGSWYSIPGDNGEPLEINSVLAKVNSQAAFKELLEQNKDYREYIENTIKNFYNKSQQIA